MATSGIDDQPRPGTSRPGGRTERTRRAVAQAVLDLLAEGNSALNPSDVADRAGVHRSTLHRRWPTREALVDEALNLYSSRLDVPDTGSFADDLIGLARALAAFFVDPSEIAGLRALAMRASPDPDPISEYWISWATELAAPFQRAIERGDIGAETNALVLLNLLIGPFVVCPVFMQGAPHPWFVDEIALAVILAAKPTPEVEARALELVGGRRVMVAPPWWSPLSPSD
jgi:AcrR family transcriptional regulator